MRKNENTALMYACENSLKEGISKTLSYGGLAFDFVFCNFVVFHAFNASETFPKPNAMVPGGFKNIFVKFSGV